MLRKKKEIVAELVEQLDPESKRNVEAAQLMIRNNNRISTYAKYLKGKKVLPCRPNAQHLCRIYGD